MKATTVMSKEEKAHADKLTQELTAFNSFSELVVANYTPSLKPRRNKDGSLDNRSRKYNTKVLSLQSYCLAVGKVYWDGQN